MAIHQDDLTSGGAGLLSTNQAQSVTTVSGVVARKFLEAIDSTTKN